MNRQMFYDVADEIERNLRHFSMDAWQVVPNDDMDDESDLDEVADVVDAMSLDALVSFEGCTACVAGFTLALALQRGADLHGRIDERARDLLGLTNDEALHLYYRSWGGRDGALRNVADEDVPAALRRMADKGSVYL